MCKNDFIDAPMGDTVGRVQFMLFGFKSEYTSFFDGNPLSIASFIGSQGVDSIVTIEKREEEKPYLCAVRWRVKKCTDNTHCSKLKKYLRYLRGAIRKNGDSLTYEEAETLLKNRFKELNKYPCKAYI